MFACAITHKVPQSVFMHLVDGSADTRAFHSKLDHRANAKIICIHGVICFGQWLSWYFSSQWDLYVRCPVYDICKGIWQIQLSQTSRYVRWKWLGWVQSGAGLKGVIKRRAVVIVEEIYFDWTTASAHHSIIIEYQWVSIFVCLIYFCTSCTFPKAFKKQDTFGVHFQCARRRIYTNIIDLCLSVGRQNDPRSWDSHVTHIANFGFNEHANCRWAE